MKRTIAVAVCSTLVVMTGCRGKPGVSEQEISGEWETIRGDWEYVCFDIGADGRLFSGYLGDRLMSSGTWSLGGGVLTVTLEGGQKNVYPVVSLKDGILDLNDGQEQYRRPRSAEQKALDLLAEVTESGIAEFGDRRRTTMPWNMAVGGQRNLDAYEITASITMKRDFSDLAPVVQGVVALLEEDFFVTSDENTTEIWSAYERGGLKVLIGTPNDPDAEVGDPLSLSVSCGWVQ